MNTPAKQFDASKLSPRDRRSFETGLAIISRKLARARLAEIALKAVPKSFRIVPSSAKKFEAVQPVRRSGRMTTHVVFSTLAD
jgi:hypothetical protein